MMKKLQVGPAYRYIIMSVIFLALTLFALLGTFPLPSTLVSSPFAPILQFFLGSLDLLAMLLSLYIAHRFSPAIGMWLIAWFVVLHASGYLAGSPLPPQAMFRQAILFVTTILSIRIIAIRNRLEEQQKKTAAELEAQRVESIKYAEELLILNGIATIGVEAADEDGLIRDAVSIMDSALRPDYFDIGLVDEKAGTIRLFRSTRTWDKGNISIPMNQGITGQVVVTGKPMRVPDVRLEPVYVAVSEEVRSELCVPLKMGSQVLGVINIESKQLSAFSEADERLFTTFGEQLVTAIQKVRLFQSEQRHAQEAEILREAGSIVAATLSQEETIQRILEQLKRVIPYDSASVQLLGDGYVEIVGVHGWADPKEVLGLRFPIPGDNPNTMIIKERKPYVLGNAPSVYKAFGEGPHSHIHSFLGAPLIVGKKLIGMLAVDNRKPDFFDERHVRLVTAFADQVALAIQNARLFSEVEKLAHTDGLTGLHNRYHFMELALHEFKRAQRYKHPMAAIMIDIDHFKLVNDTYGHAIGDEVLRNVSLRCKKTVRQIDILGRYGGEEFTTLVLNADLSGVQVVSERLRRCIADAPIDTDQGPIQVTISLGIALLDQDCKDLDDLLQRADQALYAAKQAGRNQVVFWQADL